NYLYNQAMEAWRASQGALKVVRRRDGEAPTEVTSNSQGRGGYLQLAARLARMQSEGAARLAKLAQGDNPSSNPCAPAALPPSPATDDAVDSPVLSVEYEGSYDEGAEPASALPGESATPVRAGQRRDDRAAPHAQKQVATGRRTS